MPEPSIFTVGGTVQAGGGVYVPRPADDELLQHCLVGDFCYVLTARQMGKSCLMVRTAQTLQTRGTQTVIMDLTRLGTSLQPEQWYLGLVDELVEQLDLEVDYKSWWQARARFGPTQRLSRFLREVVLEKVTAPLVIFIDEIDTTLSLAFADDFFAAIRACYNARSTDAAYKRLSFVLLGVATPGDLIRDPKRTPFNIGTRIDLSDFTFAEARPLADGFKMPRAKALQTLKWVLEWTGGHPYLTQRLCRALLERAQAEWTAETIAQVVEETFFGERSKQDGNLGFVRDMLTRRAPPRYETAVLQILRDLQKGRKIRDEEQSIPKMHLKLAGIARREGDFLAVRNKIYARVFDGRWISQNWPVSWKRRVWLLAGVALLALFIGIYGTFVVQNYGNDLRGHFTHWQAGWTHPSSATPFQDASGAKMVNIQAGQFQTGGDPQIALAECKKYYGESSCDNAMPYWQAEAPIHTVTLDEFAMDVYEVTNGQYRKCVEAGICQPPENDRSYERLRYYNDAFYNDFPVIYVSWNDATNYCEWRGARLPTEAEWEYAARGGLAGKNYPWGDVFEDGQANFCDSNCTSDWANKSLNDGYPDTSPVGSYTPNGYGLYDMAGNVWEWVNDWYSAEYYATLNGTTFNPTGPQSGDSRVLRGGSWYGNTFILRVSNRFRNTPDYRSNDSGFRCTR